MTELSEAMGTLKIEAEETHDQSIYSPHASTESGSSSSDVQSSKKEDRTKANTSAIRRLKLNEFLCASGKTPVKVAKKDWKQLSMRTKNDRVSKARDAVVASLQVISPTDPGLLWEALKSSKSVEKTLKTDEHHSDTKYLRALADAYDHASSWDTRRQVLSVMADLVPYHVIQQHIPGKFKISILHFYNNNTFSYSRS